MYEKIYKECLLKRGYRKRIRAPVRKALRSLWNEGALEEECKENDIASNVSVPVTRYPQDEEYK